MAQNQMSPALLAPARGSAEVRGGFDEDFAKVRVHINGSRAVLFYWDSTEKAFEEFDRLTGVEMFVDREARHIYRGTSDRLRRDVGTSDDQAEWTVTIVGCQDCP